MPRKLSVQLMAGITLTLVLMLGTNLWMVWQQQNRDILTDMHGKAKVVTEQLVATRLFMARNQDKINQDSAGHFEFKGLNPAAVGRGVGTIFGEITGYRLKQTRFHVRRAENAPDAFEWEALTRFADDPQMTEYWKRAEEEGRPVFRYAVPLWVEKECLMCHGGPPGELDIAGYPKEGYQVGQLGGAISVSLPMDAAIARIQRHAMTQVWVIIGVTLVSLIVIWRLSRYLVVTPLEELAGMATRIGDGEWEVSEEHLVTLDRSQELRVVGTNMEEMARNLKDLYSSLEEKVADRTRELQQANELQSQFLATVSHELRTPLTSIIAFTELLLKQAGGREREYLEDVLESSSRLLEMVNNLLDFSRLKAGRVEIFTDLMDLPELLISVIKTLRPLADKKQVTIAFTLPPDLPLVLVDPHRIRQVLFNLIGNALKFTPEGSEVNVSASYSDGMVNVAVADRGPGIPEEHRSMIFEAFRRVEAPGLQHPGSGLGLAVARDLIDMHDGQIWVEDGPEGGALFRFTLPTAPPVDDEEEELPHAVNEDNSGR